MNNKRILWLFPLVTQLICSLFLPFFNGVSVAGVGYIFLFTTFPAWLFAVVCLRYQFHQRNLLQIGVWSGIISFVNSLMGLLALTLIEPMSQAISLFEHSVAVIFSALLFALVSMMYAMVILRWFLPKKC